jgi:hypothetical protein
VNDSNGGPAIVAGWYPDPTARFELRYHNGAAWTADVSTNGVRYVDPSGTSPSGRPPAGAAGRNGPAVAAMVLGIVSIGIGWLPFVVAIGIVASVLAIVLGAVGRARAKRTGTGSGYALTGLITGLVGALVCVGGVLFTIAFVRELDRYSNPAVNTVEIEQCSLEGSAATATGQITNLGTEPADFSIQIDFVRPGTDNPDRRARVPVVDVPPGETAPFSVTRAVSLDEIDCSVGRVDGPLPFGVEIDN